MFQRRFKVGTDIEVIVSGLRLERLLSEQKTKKSMTRKEGHQKCILNIKEPSTKRKNALVWGATKFWHEVTCYITPASIEAEKKQQQILHNLTREKSTTLDISSFHFQSSLQSISVTLINFSACSRREKMDEKLQPYPSITSIKCITKTKTKENRVPRT